MKKILLDVDEVITGGEFLLLINNFLGTDYKEEDMKGYYMQDVLGDRKEEFFQKFGKEDLYKNSKLYDDVYEVLEKLNNYYEIYICSAYIYKEVVNDCGNFLKQKYEFLLRELPFLDPNKFIFTSSKLIINADIRIDDKENNLGNATTSILYTAYHNKNINDETLKEKNIIRANNWKEIEKILIDELM